MRRINTHPQVLLLLFCFTFTTYGAEYAFEQLECPGADFTIPQDINNDGVVVGLCASESEDDAELFGFVWDGQQFETPDFGFFDPVFYGISNSGLILGTGFAFETFSAPVFTVPLDGGIDEVETYEIPDAFLPFSGSINDSGQFVGSYLGSADDIISFLKLGDEIEELTLPGLSHISAVDINEAGQIVGSALNDAEEGVGYILQGEELTIFNHPDGETELLAINNVGAIAGAVTTDNASRTFIYDGETFEDFAFPGADATVIWGLNDHGVMVGQYFLDNSEFGFIATPVPEPDSLALLLLGVAFAAGRPRRGGPPGECQDSHLSLIHVILSLAKPFESFGRKS